jgi:hypothetical protein
MILSENRFTLFRIMLQRGERTMTAALVLLSTLPLSLVAIAALPYLLSLASNASQAIALCLMTSMFTVLLSNDFERAGLAWFVGMLIAAVAVREKYRVI